MESINRVNVVLFNVPESSGVPDPVRENNAEQVQLILNKIENAITYNPSEIIRLGRVSNRPRPIKMNSPFQVRTVFQKKNFTFGSVIRDDKTHRQTQYLNELRYKLKEYNDQARTNKAIKCIEGTIVDKNPTKNY